MKRQSRTILAAALATVEELRAGGHVALFAGGCVRDRLLEIEPKDIDIATDAPPARVAELFPRARHVGAKFGVMLVRKFGHDIEVATFRSDGTYSDGRHPDEVTFGSETDDARRRDFTINGMFFDPHSERVIDHVDGLADLQAGVIRTIGDADSRFAEDHLRMLRAVRFASRLGFVIENATLSAIKRLASHLESISAERVWLELAAILTASSRAKGWELLVSAGLRGHLSRKWPSAPEEDRVIQDRLTALPDTVIAEALALATCICSRSESQVTQICRALRVSNRLTNSVAWLVRSLPVVRDESQLDLAGLKVLMACADWEHLVELLRADLLSAQLDLAVHEQVRARAAAIVPEDVAPRPLLNGGDITAIGVRPGPHFGKILQAVYHAQLNEQISTREEAMKMADSMAASADG